MDPRPLVVIAVNGGAFMGRVLLGFHQSQYQVEPSPMTDTARPNVLMILADQHHADLLGCAGHPQAITPNLDTLAARGVRFTRAYCQNPICTPSRVSILSGQYPHNTGYFGLSGPAPAALPNLFRHFRRHGYRTAAYGKLHLPESPRNWIADDVDEFGDSYESADGTFGRSDYLDGLQADGLRDKEDSWHNRTGYYSRHSIPGDARPSDMPYERTQEVWCAGRAMDFIAADDDAPFCIQVAFQKPHHPLFPVQRFWDMYPADLELPSTFAQDPSHRSPNFQNMFTKLRNGNGEFGSACDTYEDVARRMWRGTLACVSQLDDVVGILLRFLADRGLADNTIVTYGSDHGAYHTIHGLPEKAPGICSDAVCRVPMIWRVPGSAQDGRVCDRLIENVDTLPTLAALCGLPAPDWADGRDATPLLAGRGDSIRDAAFTENALSKSVRFGRWRMTYYPTPIYGGAYGGELYDLEADPDETCNLYADPDHHPVVMQGMRHILDWLTTTQRVVTGMPGSGEGSGIDGTRRYQLAEDGRMPNPLQPAAHLAEHGPGNYV